MNNSDSIVLIIDDSQAVARYLELLLKKHFNVSSIIAHNPKIGFEFLKDHKPGLIILDMQMPFMDGYSMLQIIRADPATKDIPVVVCTALSTPELFAGLVKLNISDYIVKPLSTNVVVKKLGKIFDNINNNNKGKWLKV